MTDQYKELRIAASHVPDAPWAKQAIQLLDEMDAVGAGGVSGEPLPNRRGLGWLKRLYEEGGHQMPVMELLPDDEAVMDFGMCKLREWVGLINIADDETRAILRQGLKEEIELMFSRSVDHPSTYSQNKWFDWAGGDNPVPGCLVEFKLAGESRIYRSQSEDVRWTREGGGDVTSYRIVK